MVRRTLGQVQMLYFLAVALILSTGEARERHKPNQLTVKKECPESGMSLCGCQAVPNEALRNLTQLYKQDIHAEAYCGEQFCHQTCRRSVCSFAMGTLGELCTTTIIDEAWVIFVRNAECSFDQGMRTFRCVKGKSVVYPDEQTYRAITEGYCIPTCDMDVALFRCTFEPRFREESNMHRSELESPPFTTITGAGINLTEAASPDPVQSPEAGSSPQPGTDSEEPEAPADTEPGVAGGKPKDDDEKDTGGAGKESGSGSDGSDDDDDGKDGDASISTTKQPETADEAGSSPDPSPETVDSPPDSSPETVDSPPSGGSDSDGDKPKGDDDEDDDSGKSSDEPEMPDGRKKLKPDKGSEDTEESPVDDGKSPPPGRTPDDSPADDDDESSKPGGGSDTGGDDDFVDDSDDMLSEEPSEGPGEPPDATASASSIGPDEGPSDDFDDDEEDIIDSPDPAPGDDDDESGPMVSPDPIGGGEGDNEPSADPTDTSDGDDEPSTDPTDPTHGGSDGYTLYFSPFRECNQVCAQAGDSYKERSITCRDSAGVPVPLESCVLPPDLSERFFLKCQNDECGPDYYIVLFDWTTCPKSCKEIDETGLAIPNYSTRDYECRRVSDDSLTDKEDCQSLIEEEELLLEIECNTVPCERFGYSTSEWGFCNCESWTQEREATCIRWATGEEVDATLCEARNLTTPTTNRKCYPQDCFGSGQSRKILQQNLDYCSFTECSKKGRCSNQKCTCRRGYEGPDCQIDTRRNSQCSVPSLLDNEGDCCSSGVFDYTGVCCDGLNGETDIDIEGNCCVGRPLDACGRCDEDIQYYLDAAGQCCEVIDASGTCCHSGYVDECGVCDGYDRSCNTTISFNVQVDNKRVMRECTRELRSIVEIALDITDMPLETHPIGKEKITFCRTNITETSGFIQFRVDSVLNNKKVRRDCRIQGLTSEKLPMCGNGVCETGETETCPRDCDLHIQLCEIDQGLFNQPVMCSGHGLCSFANTAECSCFTGYTGKNCERCAQGFFRVGNDSRCIAGQAFANKDFSEPASSPSVTQESVTLTETSPDVIPRQDPGSGVANSNDSGQSTYFLVAAAVVLCLFLCAVFILLAVRKVRKKDTPADRQESTVLNASHTDSSHGDPAEPSSSNSTPHDD